MDRKRRFDALDFVDIFEFNMAASGDTDIPSADQVTTSLGFLTKLQSSDPEFADDDGLFTQNLVEKLYDSDPPDEGEFYKFITGDNIVASNSNWSMAQDNALRSRIYAMVGLEEYNYRNLEYDFKRVQLFTRTNNALSSNGYIDMFANKYSDNKDYEVDLSALGDGKVDPFILNLKSSSGDDNYAGKTGDVRYQF